MENKVLTFSVNIIKSYQRVLTFITYILHSLRCGRMGYRALCNSVIPEVLSIRNGCFTYEQKSLPIIKKKKKKLLPPFFLPFPSLFFS